MNGKGLWLLLKSPHTTNKVFVNLILILSWLIEIYFLKIKLNLLFNVENVYVIVSIILDSISNGVDILKYL